MNRRLLGAKYEEKAVGYLETRGYVVRARNYRCPRGEIDLIASHLGYLVFIEVKYRRDAHSGYGIEAVDRRKQRRIIQAALWYMAQEQIPEEQPCRFDVLAFLGEQATLTENAFEL